MFISSLTELCIKFLILYFDIKVFDMTIINFIRQALYTSQSWDSPIDSSHVVACSRDVKGTDDECLSV